MKTLVTDEMLDTFCVSGTYDQIADAARKRIKGLTDTLSFPLPFDATERRPQLAEAVQSLKQLKGADEWRAKANAGGVIRRSLFCIDDRCRHVWRT